MMWKYFTLCLHRMFGSARIVVRICSLSLLLCSAKKEVTMTIGISRNQAAPDGGKIVMHALLVPKARNIEVAMACRRGERSAA